MKCWIDRYKAAKDWNRRQSGENRKQCVFYEEIYQVVGCRDCVTLCHREKSGNEEKIVPEEQKKEKRNQRKLSGKRAQEEDQEEEYKEMLKAASTGMEEQNQEMSSVVWQILIGFKNNKLIIWTP